MCVWLVRLIVFSDIHTREQLNNLLGRNSDRPEPTRTVRVQSWELHSTLSRDAELEDHLADLVERADSMKKVLRPLSDQLASEGRETVGLQVALTCRGWPISIDDDLAIRIPKETIEFISEIRASIGLVVSHRDPL